MTKKEYFAYGSNLNFEQMAYRCPEATAVGTAKLEGYELAFRGGYLTILPKEGATVEGLIWSVSEQDEAQLDCYEGYPKHYGKETVMVKDSEENAHEIMVYTMNEPYRDILITPDIMYVSRVLKGCDKAGISGKPVLEALERCRKEYRKSNIKLAMKRDKGNPER